MSPYGSVNRCCQRQIVRRLLESRVVTCASPGYLAQHGKPRPAAGSCAARMHPVS